MAREKIEVVFFDLGNTLIYFNGRESDVLLSSDQALYHQLVDSGLQLDWDPFFEQFSTRMKTYYRQRDIDLFELTTKKVLEVTLADFGIQDISKEQIQSALNKMYEVSQSYWRLEADAVFTLEKLLGLGCRLGIISNASDANDVYTLLYKNQIMNYFETVVVSANTGIRKPHPGIFQVALDQMNVLPYEAMMVGDRLDADIKGAQRLDMRNTWISRRADPQSLIRYPKIRPEYSINSLAELIPVVQRYLS